MKQLIEEQRKDFDIWFKEYPGVPTIEEMQEWYEDRFKQFIDELIAREEGEIKEFQTQKDGEYHFGENQKTIGWNLAKEFTIAHLKKLKEELN